MAMAPTTDLSGVITQLINGNNLLAAIQQTLKAGIAIQPVLPSYTVANLPTKGATGQFAWASNGRKASEGVGAGTGVPVYFNPATSTWLDFYSNAQVQA